MDCHLEAYEREIPAEALRFKRVGTLFESPHFDLYIEQCECNRIYVHCLIEIIMFDDDDDNWDFWVATNPDEVNALRQQPFAAAELIQSRRHITRNWKMETYWANGAEIALIRGPG